VGGSQRSRRGAWGRGRVVKYYILSCTGSTCTCTCMFESGDFWRNIEYFAQKSQFMPGNQYFSEICHEKSVFFITLRYKNRKFSQICPERTILENGIVLWKCLKIESLLKFALKNRFLLWNRLKIKIFRKFNLKNRILLWNYLKNRIFRKCALKNRFIVCGIAWKNLNFLKFS